MSLPQAKTEGSFVTPPASMPMPLPYPDHQQVFVNISLEQILKRLSYLYLHYYHQSPGHHHLLLEIVHQPPNCLCFSTLPPSHSILGSAMRIIWQIMQISPWYRLTCFSFLLYLKSTPLPVVYKDLHDLICAHIANIIFCHFPPHLAPVKAVLVSFPLMSQTTFCLLHPLPGVCFPTHFHVATSFPSCTCSPVGGSQARVSLGSPGRLVKQRLGCSVRICISHRFKGDANGAVQGPQLSLTHYSQ